MSERQDEDTSESMSFEGVSFEAMAMDTPLLFDPPMRHLAADPAGFDFYWKLLQRVFQLPPPGKFPPLGKNAISEDEQTRVVRYVAIAEDLARSAVLSAKAEVRVSIVDNGTRAKIERHNFPPRDATVGFATLFRQLYSPSEKGSFDQVAKIIGRANEEADDVLASTRREQLRRWTKAQNRLKGSSLDQLLSAQLEIEGKWNSALTPKTHDLNPQQLISLYFSGDLIHWGDSREQLAIFQGVSDLSAMRDIDFFRAMAALAHIYMGFGELVAAALSGVIVKAV